MKDRLFFKIKKMSNGIDIHYQKVDVPFVYLSIIIPVGSTHSISTNEGGINGVAHFLEHMIFERSKNFPEKGVLEKFVDLNGGYINADVGLEETIFYLSISNKLFDKAMSRFCEHLFNPVFKEEDIKIQREIIRNERKQKERYYPENNEIDNYLNTKWMKTERVPIRQLFGSDSDLNKIDIKILERFNCNYRSKKIKVLVSGKFNLKNIEKIFSKYFFQNIKLKKNIEHIDWKEKKYKNKKFKDIKHPIYVIGGIFNNISLKDEWGIRFLGILLTNYSHGPLYTWLRKEKGISYSMRFSDDSYGKEIFWKMYIPTNKMADVEEIRLNIHKKIKEILNDAKLIKNEVKRRLYRRVFFYQDIADRMDMAENYLIRDGVIYTEKYFDNLTKIFENSKELEKIYDKYFSKKVVREFLCLSK